MKSNLPRAPFRPSATALLLAACLFQAGCATHKPARSQANAENDSPFSFWQPHLLYLLPAPCPRLYVEVDAVEGCRPADDTLNRLRDFLATHCKKPGGIDIVRSDVIPRDRAVGVLPSALARRYLNGPPDNPAGAPPAFLYVLFYDDVLSDRPAVVETGHAGARTAKPLRLVNRNPHVDVLPYPAMIYMNAHWGSKAVRDAALVHEAGHVLGLAFRPANAAEGHCLSRTCLMNSSLHVVRFVLGLDHAMDEQLCQRCLAQLAESRALPPPGNVRFVGPVLVRSEPGYHVLSLPHRAKVVLGDFSPQDCRDFAAAVRAETPAAADPETERSVNASGSDELLRDPAKLRELLLRLGADPDPMVRRVAPKLWTACAGQYYASGQFANAVDACRQAILADPEDDSGYNLLAWLKATCADPSIRDGKEAVAAATKACELSHWKNCEWIDTLAAACAEAGDFKRAVQFQKQALRTGNPTESQRNAMRARAALYEQSQPFRDEPANTPAPGSTSIGSPATRQPRDEGIS